MQFIYKSGSVAVVAALKRGGCTSKDQGLAAKYGVTTEPPADQPWGMRDFVIIDPTGVLWRIAQNVPAEAAGAPRG